MTVFDKLKRARMFGLIGQPVVCHVPHSIRGTLHYSDKTKRFYITDKSRMVGYNVSPDCYDQVEFDRYGS